MKCFGEFYFLEKMHKLYQCCRNSLLSSWEEGHVAKSKVQMEAGHRTEGSRYYGNIGRADALVLQLCCVLVTVCIVPGVEVRERPGAGLVNTGSRSRGQEGGELLYF